MDEINCHALWRRWKRQGLMLDEWEREVLRDLKELSDGDLSPGTQARRDELTKTLRRLYQLREV